MRKNTPANIAKAMITITAFFHTII